MEEEESAYSEDFESAGEEEVEEE
jgi:hypothetical protein